MSLPARTLIHLIEGLIDHRPARSLRNVLVRANPNPTINPDISKCINEQLCTGLVGLFLQDRGWKPIQRPPHAKPTRLWEAYPEFELVFSEHSQRLLVDVIAQPILAADAQLSPLPPKTIGDEVVLFLTARLFVQAKLGEAIQHHNCFATSDLCRLAFPQYLPPQTSDWSLWGSPSGLCVIDALQPVLTTHLLRAEHQKIATTSDAIMTAIGTAQSQAAADFLSFVDRSNRRDLARCYLQTLDDLTQTFGRSDDWIRNLQPLESVADRARSAVAAGAILSTAETLTRWFNEARSVHFLDDDYNTNQILLSSWDGWLLDVCEAASERLRGLDPLHVASSH